MEDNGSASLNASTNSVGESGEGVLGGITVVGCDAEGAAAIRQTAGSTAETSGDEGKDHWNQEPVHQYR